MAQSYSLEKFPLCSVIINNFNQRKITERCLERVFRSKYQPFEVIVVDNGSTDDSGEFLRNLAGKESRLKLAMNKENLGPAAGRNQAAAIARGKYLAFLDNDTLPQTDWLIAPIRLMETNPLVGICQSKIVSLDNRRELESVGDFINQWGFLVSRNHLHEIDRGQFDKNARIFNAKSAAMTVRKKAFDLVDGFDPDYFIYVEETDFCWRVQLVGYQVWYVYNSLVRHQFGGTKITSSGDQHRRVRFHGTKNYLTTVFKNVGRENLVSIFLPHLFFWKIFSLFMLIRGKVKSFFYIWGGILWFFSNIFKQWEKRKKIQNQRKINDRRLFASLMKRRGLYYYYSSFRRAVHEGIREAGD